MRLQQDRATNGPASPSSGRALRRLLGPVAYLPANAPTGTWRFARPSIEGALCNKCGLCIQYCPSGVIGYSADGCRVDYDYCKGCSICVHVCNRKAITMTPEPSAREVNHHAG